MWVHQSQRTDDITTTKHSKTQRLHMKWLFFVCEMGFELACIHYTPHQYFMMMSSNGNIFRFIGPLWGESTGPRWVPLTKESDAELSCFFYLSLNKRLSKRSTRRWFETPSRSLWRHCNVETTLLTITECWNEGISLYLPSSPNEFSQGCKLSNGVSTL